MKKQVDYIKILRNAVKDERIDYIDTLRKCQEDFTKNPLSKAAADTGQHAWVANFEIETLGENFKKLLIPIKQDCATNIVAFDLLKGKFIIVDSQAINTAAIMTLTATGYKPLRMNDGIFDGTLDDTIVNYKSFWELDVNSLFNLFAANKTEELIQVYKNALLKRIDVLEQAVKNMSNDDVDFKITSDGRVLAPIELYYGAAQTIYSKLNADYVTVPKHIVESIFILGLCDDADLRMLNHFEFLKHINKSDNNEDFTTNEVLYWLSLKNQFDNLYR